MSKIVVASCLGTLSIPLVCTDHCTHDTFIFIVDELNHMVSGQ